MHRALVRTAAAALLLAMPAMAHAQGARTTGTFGGPYFQVTPFLGYVWGGGFPTSGISGVPDGSIRADDSMGWGVELGWSPGGSSWVTGTYLRQDTKAAFYPTGTNTASQKQDFAINYIHVGGRQLFGHAKVQPYIGGGLGLVVYDPKEQVGTNTQFSMSLEGGAQYMFGRAEKVGLRAHLRGWWGFVPNGQVVIWCDWWGFCAAGQGTSTVGQGEVSIGTVIRF